MTEKMTEKILKILKDLGGTSEQSFKSPKKIPKKILKKKKKKKKKKKNRGNQN
jgi:hypothetical protein